ncbi:hypothetical protein [Actinomadura chokoriensis]|uniref:hypothetical protein n=1 Tax=Actinomadura chokoriensis TaxID=454156 RepID=UPI0031F85034
MATIVTEPVQAIRCSPAASGSSPRPVWKYCAVKNSEADRSSPAAFPAAKPRRRNSSGGTIGCAAARCQTTKPAPQAAPAMSVPATSALPHPAACERTSPHTGPSAAPVVSRTAKLRL